MSIKPVWIVCDMNTIPLCDPNTGDTLEFKSEKAAIESAKKHACDSCDSEAWVFKLSHVASRTNEATVEAVK